MLRHLYHQILLPVIDARVGNLECAIYRRQLAFTKFNVDHRSDNLDNLSYSDHFFPPEIRSLSLRKTERPVDLFNKNPSTEGKKGPLALLPFPQFVFPASSTCSAVKKLINLLQRLGTANDLD
jgi:hypothetical protein